MNLIEVNRNLIRLLRYVGGTDAEIEEIHVGSVVGSAEASTSISRRAERSCNAFAYRTTQITWVLPQQVPLRQRGNRVPRMLDMSRCVLGISLQHPGS
jgi:hypothetical protein